MRLENQGFHAETSHVYLTSRLWWLGISMMVIGEIGNFMAYGFGPASVVAPLGTTTVVGKVRSCLSIQIMPPSDLYSSQPKTQSQVKFQKKTQQILHPDSRLDIFILRNLHVLTRRVPLYTQNEYCYQ